MSKRRFSPIAKAQYRLNRVAPMWVELLLIVREAARRPDYAGPSPQSVQRILADIEATKIAVDHWFEAVNSTAPRIRITQAMKLKAIFEAQARQVLDC